MAAEGSGKNKKTAKHAAAKHILDQLISQGKWIEWQIPGRTQTEAQQYL